MKKNLLFSLAAVLILCVGIAVGMNFNKQKNTSDSTPEKEAAPEEVKYSDNKVVSDESKDSIKSIEYMTQEDKVWVFQETYDNTQQMVKDQGGSDSQCFEVELADLPIYLDYYKNMFEGRVSPGIDTLREEYKTWRIENYGGGTSSKPTQAQNQSQQKPSQSQSQAQTQQKPSSNQNQSSSNNSGNGSTSGSSSLGPLGSSGASHNSINIIGENRTQEQIEKDIQATKEASEKSTLSQNANWS